MDNQKDKKHFIGDKHKGTNYCDELLLFNDDNIAFVPVENIRSIKRVIDNLEDMRLRLNRINT